jgi:hypothetical protein
MGTENLNDFKKKCGFEKIPAPVPTPAPARAPKKTKVSSTLSMIRESLERESAEAKVIEGKSSKDDTPVFWSPGIFQRGGFIPKYIKWQKGTDSLQMGREMQPYDYTYNSAKDLYERK